MKKTLKIPILFVLFMLIYFAFNLYRLAPNGTKAFSVYSFSVSKNTLENEIDSLVLYDKKIFRDTANVDSTEKFYNTASYFTVAIDSLEFTFRYEGDSLYWKKSKEGIKIFLTSINSNNKTNLSNDEKLKIIEKEFLAKVKYRFTKSE